MFETFKAIKNDLRSSTGIFRALKRHTFCQADGYCTYEFHDFGVAAEAEFTTVHECDVSAQAFEVCPNDGSRLSYNPLWGGLYYLKESGCDEPWEVPAQDLYELHLDTGSFVLSQTNEGVNVWRPIEQEEEDAILRKLLLLGGHIDVYDMHSFTKWLSKVPDSVRDAVKHARRVIHEATSWHPAYLAIIVADTREVMFGKRGEDDKGWVSNIQRVG